MDSGSLRAPRRPSGPSGTRATGRGASGVATVLRRTVTGERSAGPSRTAGKRGPSQAQCLQAWLPCHQWAILSVPQSLSEAPHFRSTPSVAAEA